jgi:hypothetical protein
MPEKLVPIKDGDTRVIGEREYELTAGGLRMQCAASFVQDYTFEGLQAQKAKHEARLAEVNVLLAKFTELMAAKAAPEPDPEPVP